MNLAMVRYILGYILQIEGALLLAPALVAFIYQEGTIQPLLVTAFLAFALGLMLRWHKPKNQIIYAKEGFAVVSAAWILLSAVGALPFWLSQEIPFYLDAFFETVSGFTTTGASILPAVEDLSLSLVFWRSFAHWIGGMGVLVFALAIIPMADNRSMYLMRAEVPGPTAGKLVPRMKDTVKILYSIYLGMTILQIILLKLAGMPWYDTLINTFGSAGTGGFSNRNLSVGAYQNGTYEWIIGIFMMLFGVNFNLYYFLLTKKFKDIWKNEELRLYLAIIALATIGITINLGGLKNNLSGSLRTSFFQVSSIITTTGYSSTDFNLWPAFSKTILILLMFFGASAGSTAGGIKISRILLIWRMIIRELKRLLHPRSVGVIKLENKTVSEKTLQGVSIFILVYLIIFASSLVFLSLDNVDFETNFTSVLTCLNNIGPGFSLVGPMGNFGFYSPLSKIILSLNMLLGRLEIFPLLLSLMPSFWKQK
ncbi:MAG: TrkH family potassium uptake protein [Firmicutes bacterium]|jgi:trk system potassium uptake protein TrkH|nr:TrkH family potassium uptake protein [Bacillota bacterium]